MIDMFCPYCGYEISIGDRGEYADQSELHQKECPKCQKYFVFTTFIFFDYETFTADCLNGSPHDYKPTRTHPPSLTKMRCSMCKDERDLTDEEYRIYVTKEQQ